MNERFQRVFTNLPIPERSNCIYVDQTHGPLSWHIVRLEVIANTEIGLRALKALDEMGLI